MASLDRMYILYSILPREIVGEKPIDVFFEWFDDALDHRSFHDRIHVQKLTRQHLPPHKSMLMVRFVLNFLWAFNLLYVIICELGEKSTTNRSHGFLSITDTSQVVPWFKAHG